MMKFASYIKDLFVGFMKKPKIEYVSLVNKAANQTGFDSIDVYLDNGSVMVAKTFGELDTIVTKIELDDEEGIVPEKNVNKNRKGTPMKVYKVEAVDEASLEKAKTRFEGEYTQEGLTLVAKGTPELLEKEINDSYDDGEMTMFFCKSITPDATEEVAGEEEEVVATPDPEPSTDETVTVKSSGVSEEDMKAMFATLSTSIVETITKSLSNDITKKVDTLKTELTQEMATVAKSITDIKGDIDKIGEEHADVVKFAQRIQGENEELKESPKPRAPKTTPTVPMGSAARHPWMNR
jgi:hypothetical protein